MNSKWNEKGFTFMVKAKILNSFPLESIWSNVADMWLGSEIVTLIQ